MIDSSQHVKKCSKLAVKTTSIHHSDGFVVNFKHIFAQWVVLCPDYYLKSLLQPALKCHEPVFQNIEQRHFQVKL